MIIHVTEEHIRRGVPTSVCGCPIALALNDALCDVYLVGKDSFAPYLSGRKIQRFQKKAQIFIERFDAGIPVKPFSFRIRRPE